MPDNAHPSLLRGPIWLVALGWLIAAAIALAFEPTYAMLAVALMSLLLGALLLSITEVRMSRAFARLTRSLHGVGASEDSPLGQALSRIADELNQYEEEAIELAHKLREDRTRRVQRLLALRHEVRTPLNSILGFTEVLLDGIDGTLTETQREDLEIIQASGVRLRWLFDQMLNLPDGDRTVTLTPASFDLRELVEAVASELQAMRSHGSAHKTAIEIPEGLRIRADREITMRALVALVDWASRQVASGAVRLAWADGALTLEVKEASAHTRRLSSMPPELSRLDELEPDSLSQTWPVAFAARAFAYQGGSVLLDATADQAWCIRIVLPRQEAR